MLRKLLRIERKAAGRLVALDTMPHARWSARDYAGLARGDVVRFTWGGSLVNPAAWPVPAIATATVEDDYTLRLKVAMAPRSFLWLSIESRNATVAP